MTPEECRTLLDGAANLVVLTGAGISTAAGVPDFRGPEGLYVTRKYDPDTVFEIGSFRRDPRPFYDFTRDFLGVLDAIEPTFTHRFLARLEAEGRLAVLITQNIDSLHHRAGNERVIAVHGDYWSAHCLDCGAAYDLPALRSKVERQEVPTCDECGGVVKPDVVFFGEAVHGLDEAATAMRSADLVLVLGSSLTVFPAAALPELARCPVVVVNSGPVGLAPGPDRFFVDADLDDYFMRVAAAGSSAG